MDTIPHQNKTRTSWNKGLKTAHLKTEKKCCACKKVKPVSDFYHNKTSSDGYAQMCKTCDNERTQARDKHKSMLARDTRNEEIKNIVPMTCIYALIDPETNEIRYIGKANNPEQRYKRHLRQSDDTYKQRWINDLKSRELKPILHIIEEIPFEQWEEREKYWIAFYQAQGNHLTNTHEGGSGGIYNDRNMAEKVSSKLKGRPSKLRGVKRPPRDPEWSAKISAGHKGKKQSPEHIAKAANARQGKKFTPERKANISTALTGRKLSPEHKQSLVKGWEKRRKREAREKQTPPLE